MFCKKCGSVISDGALFCKKCGNKIIRKNPTFEGDDAQNGESLKRAVLCGKCGAVISDGALFCKKCGNKVGESPAAASSANTETSLIGRHIASQHSTPGLVSRKSRIAGYIIGAAGITAAVVMCIVVLNRPPRTNSTNSGSNYVSQSSNSAGITPSGTASNSTGETTNNNTGGTTSVAPSGNTGGNTQPSYPTNSPSEPITVGMVTNFTATDIKSSSINLKWDKDDTAKGYRIYQKNGSSWDIIQTISQNSTTTFAVSGLNEGTDYDFKIVSFNGSETGGEVTCCVNTAVDGTYVDVDCTYCVGGVCSHCNGTGEASYGPYGCDWCDTKEFLGKGDGKCYICHGKGCTQSYKSGKSGSATVGNEYTAPSGGNGNGNNGNGGIGGGDCPKCDGKGLIKCPYCDWGFVNCTKCSGSGTYYDTYSKRVKNCPYCSAGKVSCKSCGGRGSTFCLACGGDGCV